MDLIEKYIEDDEALQEFTKAQFKSIDEGNIGMIDKSMVINAVNGFLDDNLLLNIIQEDIDALTQGSEQLKGDDDIDFNTFHSNVKIAFQAALNKNL